MAHQAFHLSGVGKLVPNLFGRIAALARYIGRPPQVIVKMDSVIPTSEYLNSLNISPIRSNFKKEDQLCIHLMCAILYFAEQIDGEGNIKVVPVYKSDGEISSDFLNLYTIGMAATKEDTINARSIAKNLQRLLRRRMFADIVEIDGNTLRFRPLLPDVLKSLYERNRYGGSQHVTAREERECAAQEDFSRPENVRRMKIACNFLLEFIDRLRHSQKKDYVSWQSVQKRYENMVSNVDNQDEDLMDKYKRYGLNFNEPVLNSEVVKKLTGQSSITKGLSHPIFHRVRYASNSGMLMVGFNGNAKFYSEKELKEAGEAGETSRSTSSIKTVYSETFKQIHSAVEGPIRRRQPDNTSLHQHNILSPVFEVKNDERKTGRNNAKVPRRSDVVEPQYVTTFASEEECGSERSSEHSMDETGVYTTDEEEEEEVSVDVEKSIGTDMIPRECCGNDMNVVLEPLEDVSSAPRTGLSNHTFAHQHSNRTSQRSSGFGAYKAVSCLEERESNWKKAYDKPMQRMASLSQRTVIVNKRCEIRGNSEFQQESVLRDSNKIHSKISREHGDYVEGCLDSNSVRSSRGVNDSDVHAYQNYKSLDEGATMGHGYIRHSFRSGANQERSMDNISNETKLGDFANMCDDLEQTSVSDLPSSRMGTCGADSSFFNPPASRIVTCREDSSRRSSKNSSPSDSGTSCGDSSNHHSGQSTALPALTVTCDERACLRMIRDFGYLHRNPNTCGLAILETILNLLPIRSVEYWIPLIHSHLEEVGIEMFRNTHVIVWKGSDNFD